MIFTLVTCNRLTWLLDVLYSKLPVALKAPCHKTAKRDSPCERGEFRFVMGAYRLRQILMNQLDSEPHRLRRTVRRSRRAQLEEYFAKRRVELWHYQRRLTHGTVHSLLPVPDKMIAGTGRGYSSPCPRGSRGMPKGSLPIGALETRGHALFAQLGKIPAAVCSGPYRPIEPTSNLSAAALSDIAHWPR